MAKHSRRPTTLPIGTISAGTLRSQDLIGALLPEIEALRLSAADRRTVRILAKQYHAWPEPEPNDNHAIEIASFELSDIYRELAELAETLTPAYCYFGSTEGDGACIGVWPCPEAIEGDGDVFQGGDDLPSTGAPGAQEFGYWLHVNDHGNMTLYARVGQTWARYREVWSVV